MTVLELFVINQSLKHAWCLLSCECLAFHRYDSRDSACEELVFPCSCPLLAQQAEGSTVPDSMEPGHFASYPRRRDPSTEQVVSLLAYNSNFILPLDPLFSFFRH